MNDQATLPEHGLEQKVLPISGELTIYRTTELRQTLLAALAEPVSAPDGLALDLSGVSELDSAGLQLLLSARRTAAAAGRRLDFLNPSAPVISVWRMLDLPTPDNPRPVGSPGTEPHPGPAEEESAP